MKLLTIFFLARYAVAASSLPPPLAATIRKGEIEKCQIKSFQPTILTPVAANAISSNKLQYDPKSSKRQIAIFYTKVNAVFFSPLVIKVFKGCYPTENKT